MQTPLTVKLIIALVLGFHPFLAHAQPKVVTTIKPLQMIASAIMDGVATPDLLIPSQQSPHYFSLRPSDAATLRTADVIVWVGPQMETYLAAAIEQAAAKATLQADKLEGIILLSPTGHEDEEHENHDHSYDPHLWLDSHNVQLIANDLAARLALLDAANAPLYRANLELFTMRLAALEKDLAAAGTKIRIGNYVVYHNGIAYLERQLGIEHLFVVVPNHDIQPGIRHLLAAREQVQNSRPDCLLLDINANPATVATVFEGVSVRQVTLDAMGDSIPPSPESYIELMARMARDIGLCVEP